MAAKQASFFTNHLFSEIICIINQRKAARKATGARSGLVGTGEFLHDAGDEILRIAE